MKLTLLGIVSLLAFVANIRAVRLIGNTTNADTAQGRIIGGELAEKGFAPYQISLQGMYGGHMCGGAIIEPRWVVTAAHCVTGYNPSYLRVITGTNVYFEPNATYEVQEFWTHCNHDIPEYHNDIAIMYLKEPIVFNELTQPVPLPVKPMQDGDEVILTGWGDTILWGETPDNLQKLYTKFVSHKRCSEIYKNSDMLDCGHICTFTQRGQGSCHGDSGGPLISNGYLVGLVNWGMPCATGEPDAHANVFYYRNWIRQIISGNCRSCQCSASNYPGTRGN